MPNSILNAVKSQSWVVIPIIQDLEKEIRKERVHAIIRCATAKAYVNYCELYGF